MLSFFQKKNRKRSVKIFASLLFALQIFGLLAVQPAAAQIGGAVVNTTVVDNPRTISETIQKLNLSTGTALRLSAASALMNAVEYFVRKIAYDTATYVASGGNGQSSLIYQQGFGDYLAGVAKDSAADAIGTLGQPFGLNLCNFPDLRVQVFLQIGLKNLYGQGPPTPNCSWQQLAGQWGPDAFRARFGQGAGKYIADKFNANLSVQNSDFGIALGAIGKIDALQEGAVAAANSARIANQGIKDVTDVISGNVKTPSKLVQEDLNTLSAKDLEDQTVAQTAGFYAADLPQLFPLAASVFLNTLASQLLQKILTKGLLPAGPAPAGTSFDANFFGLVADNRTAAQNAFNFLLTPNIQQANNYDPISEFASCPDHPGLNNCVINTALQTVIERARTNEPLTIKEAMDQGLLDGNAPLISPRDEVDNTSKDCYLNKLCYSNLQKLRRARIFPLGFEIAALLADPDHPPTLRQVVTGFDACDPSGRPSAQYPYCHLVNPNWVIKEPAARCTTQAVGPELLDSGVPTRRTECMDLATSIAEDASGKPVGNYGFCTEEKNVWRLNADVCQAQFATCKTYTESTGAVVSYLSRTVDTSDCNAGDTGCRAYSLEQTASGSWLPSSQVNLANKSFSLGRNQVVYLNDAGKSKTCAASADGCTALYPAAHNTDGSFALAADGTYTKDTNNADLLYLKKAPDYLGCYDANSATPQVDWPQNIADINTKISKNPACGAFAPACTPSEVGCDSYTPVSGGNTQAIPGIVGANSCPAECVGYATFRQVKTNFEAEKFPLNFIPSHGQTCDAQFAGCDQFTNLEVAAAGGEGLEYYTSLKYCEKPKPDGSNIATYYSWEGSVTQGYVLKTHRVLPISAAENTYLGRLGLTYHFPETVNDVYPVGSPAYDDDSKDSLNSFYNDRRCNADAYALRVANNGLDRAADGSSIGISDPDCRALYDSAGHVYYRLLDHLVTVSDACHEIRKTTPSFYTDSNLTDATSCSGKGGLWDPAARTCARCMQGGVYKNNACIYQTISAPGEANSCPATANGCRVYVGNTGNNVQVVVDETFEPAGTDAAALLAAKAGWDSVPPGSANVRISSEALKVGEHSLYLDVAKGARTLSAGTLKTGISYQLTFWARSNVVENLAIYFEQDDPATGATNEVGRLTFDPASKTKTQETIGADWQQYSVGPAQFTGDGSLPVRLVFERSATRGGSVAPYFLDYVHMTGLQDQVSLVKDSWKTTEGYDVPLVCDSNPNDGFPGAALGCMEYKNSANQSVFTTGFQALCREKAVGCSPVYDTHNTLGDGGEFAQAYHLLCTLPVGQIGPANCKFTVTAGASPVDYTCTVATGGHTCYIEQKVVLPDGNLPSGASVVPSTQVFPADTPNNAPIFLANQPQYQCHDREIGCMKVGAEEKVLPRTDAAGYHFTDAYIQNNPADYFGAQGQSGTLCRQEELGCMQYSAGGVVTYFKDPSVTGAGTCSYRTNVQKAGSSETYNGWYRDGVGVCSQDSRLLCQSNTDCGAGNTCDPSTPVACYGSFIRRTTDGLVYDIHSNKDPGYTGAVGVCPADANSCTELVDPSDTSNLYPNGHAYDVLMNDKIQTRAQACNGQVSLTGGCILLDQTENPNKFWSTKITYANSQNATPPFSPVSPVGDSNAQNNDTNLVLKVDRDRTCGAWLACQSSVTQTDPDGRVRTLCQSYKLCDAADSTGGACTHWVPNGSTPFTQLTQTAYINRDVSWQGVEYSGYSLFNKYQIGDMQYNAFDLSDFPSLADLQASKYVSYPLSTAAPDCKPVAGGALNTNWQACGPLSGGRCYAQQCLLPVSGFFPADAPKKGAGARDTISATDLRTLIGFYQGGSCKAFPESDSPFPTTVATKIDETSNVKKYVPSEGTPFSHNLLKDRTPLFQNANVCQPTYTISTDGKVTQTGSDCSCNYRKVTYGGLADYWPTQTNIGAEIPPGICTGGALDGQPCVPDSGTVQCADPNPPKDANGNLAPNNGTCTPKAKDETHVGLKGFCLEPDYSHPINGQAQAGVEQQYACLTWLPIDISASTLDIFNSFVSAGYDPSQDAKVAGANYGQSYCLASTKVGGKVNGSGDPSVDSTKVATWQNQYFDNLATAYFRSADGTAILNGDKNCGDSAPYIKRMCVASDPANPLFGVMQTWAWRELGGNAVVLRIDKVPYNLSDFKLENGIVYSDKPCPGTICASIFQFAPWQVINQGTAMHPPRVWNPADETGLKNDSVYPDTDAAAGRYIRAYGMSPYPDFYSVAPANFDAQVIRFPTEQRIREHDINRMYFTPLMYPQGADGVYPNMLAKDLYIDFVDLTKGGNSGSIATLRPASGFFDKSGPEFEDPNSYTSHKSGDDQQAITGKVLTYKVDAQHLGKFGTYPGSGSTLSRAITDPRNTIANRYVMVFASNFSDGSQQDGAGTFPDWFPPSGSAQVPGDQNGNGPFSAHCDTNHENWFAVGMDFNADGDFLGYISRYCMGTQMNSGDSTQGAGIMFATVATLNDQCTEVAQVYDENQLGIGQTNKAWTNRVWEHATDGTNNNTDLVHPTYGPNLLRAATANMPFGSLTLKSDILDAVIPPVVQFLNYTFRFPTGSGIPYVCNVARWRNLSIIEGGNTCNALTGYAADLVSTLSSKGVAQAQDGLHSLFATFWKQLYTDPSLAVPATRDLGKEDKSDTVGVTLAPPGVPLVPPQIYSLNIATCFGRQNAGTTCAAGEANNFTVNGHNMVSPLVQYSAKSPGPEDDRNHDGVVDPVIVANGADVTIQFFTFADDNRMPIDRVMVNWDDGYIGGADTMGLYKNRKPLCSQSDTSDMTVGLCGKQNDTKSITGITCQTDKDCPKATPWCYNTSGAFDIQNPTVHPGGDDYKFARFGNSPRACVNEAYTTDHNYVLCTATNVAAATPPSGVNVKTVADIKLINADAYTRLRGSYSLQDGDKVCVYTPKVQVKDNWGWCTGSCNGAGNTGCYDAEPGVKQCDKDKPEPWIPYKGQIIVIPQ